MKKATLYKEDNTSRDQESKTFDAPRSPTSIKRVNVIIGGNPFWIDSVRALKGYCRQVNSISTKTREMIEDDTFIEFENQETTSLDWPHKTS